MKKENQLAILKMASTDLNDNRSYTSRIITEGDEDPMLEITRDFIRKTTVIYTAKDIVRMSLKSNGDVFNAILNDISNKFRLESQNIYKNS